MKHAIYLLFTLMLCSLQTLAQQDSVMIRSTSISSKPDTFFVKMVKDGKVTDTFFVSNKISTGTKDSLFIRGYDATYVFKDSLYRNRKYDSVSRYHVYTGYQSDSGQQRKFKQQRELFSKQEREFKRTDSLYRTSAKGFARMDSLNRLNGKLFRSQDSLFRLQGMKRDSLQRLRWHADSVRIKEKLTRLKSDLQRIKEDSLIRNNKLHKKEVSMEVNCSKNGTVVIKNLSRKITVKTFNENKVRIVTVIRAEAGAETKDIDWSATLNVDIEQNKNEVLIKPANAGYITVTASSSSSGGSISSSYSYINNTSASGGGTVSSANYSGDKKSELVIYIPTNAKLEVENKYNNVAILNNLASLNIDLTNANLKMEDAETAVIRSRYGSIAAGDLKNADIKLVNSKMMSGDIDKLIIDSKYSTVTFKKSDVIEMKSISDQYSIAQVGKIVVNKNFGKFNIAQLNNSLELTGSSADLNINAINASVTEVKINNKYADVKLPLNALPNYTLQFDGNYSKVFTPFENTSDSLKKANVNFTKAVGNTNKKFTAFAISCASCSVDFR